MSDQLTDALATFTAIGAKLSSPDEGEVPNQVLIDRALQLLTAAISYCTHRLGGA